MPPLWGGFIISCNMHTTLIKTLLCCSFFYYNTHAQQLSYPIFPQTDAADDYFGIKVADPYRTFEQSASPTVQEWVEQQQDISSSLLLKYENKHQMAPMLKMYSYYNMPEIVKAGRYYVEFFLNAGTDQGASMYIKKKDGQVPALAVDPRDYKKAKDDNVSVAGYAISADDENLAFMLSYNGSDWKEVHFKHVYPFKDRDDVLKWVKFSNLKWYNNGVFYLRYPMPKEGMGTKNISPGIYYHKLGTPQAQDTLIYENQDCEECLLNFDIVDSGRVLIVYDNKAKAADYNKVLWADLKSGFDLNTLIVSSKDASFKVLDLRNNKFYVETDLDAPNGKILSFEKQETNVAAEVVAQFKDVQTHACFAGNKIIAVYINDLDYSLAVFDTTGKLITTLNFPEGGSLGYIENDWSANAIRFEYHSYLHPSYIYEYDLNEYKLKITGKTVILYNPDGLEVKKAHYTSKDGTVVPIMLAYKKGIKKNGKIPTLLYGYGGYGTVMTPFFSKKFLTHMMAGGMIAVPCIRGGGEYGSDWHKQGMREKKQNVFDDFIAAAEYLVKEGYTNNDRIALIGGSNGGLLVAAVINQRPDICKVAVAQNGVYDMLRYQHFTIGHAWQKEYGVSSNKDEFGYLYKYSPIHNVVKAAYPSMLVVTGDSDDRVMPLHSYKYAAMLQRYTTSANPVLLYVMNNAGHNTSTIEEDANILSFIYSQMGIRIRAVTGEFDN